MQPSLIDQGVSLMLYGMGTVFVFLTILVFATGLMSSLVQRFTPAEELAQKDNAVGAPEPKILAAIKLAIAAHRQSRKA